MINVILIERTTIIMKYRLQACLFVFIAFMLGCNEYIIVGVLPDISSEFGTGLSQLGLLVTIFLHLSMR